MNKIYKSISIFLFSFILLDIVLSIFLDKEIYNMINNKIKIVPIVKSNKEVGWTEVKAVNEVPYWTSEYRGPYFDFEKNKKLKCRILGLGDSIIWGSGVDGKETYFYKLSQKFKNTELINNGIPGFDLLQEIIKYGEKGLGDNTDLLIWHIWEDDGHIYNYINGVLYNSEVKVNNLGNPELFGFIDEGFNYLLIKNSFLYNKFLKIKLKGDIKETKIDNEKYVIDKQKEIINNYLGKKSYKKVLIIFSPSLENNTYKGNRWIFDGYPRIYKEIEKSFSGIENVNILYLDKFFVGVNVEDIRYDSICHFNEKGHQIIADNLYNYIKTNKLLDEKCY